MGGEAVVLLASRHPDHVQRLRLIDGGLPTAPRDPSETAPAPTAAIIQRLAQTYRRVEDYLQRWQSHPALAHS
jgi:pimeloyl-ACP methyl ester carboxylesterase